MKFNILDFLLPKETKFFDYLTKQVEYLIEACKVFEDVVNHIDSFSEEALKKRLADVKIFEMKGDEVERKIIEELHKTFITPLDREDIHLMAINLDRALDTLNSISQKIYTYGIRKVPEAVCKFAELIVEISEELIHLFGSLKTKKDVTPILKKMHDVENRGDSLFYNSMAALFKDMTNHPIEIIKIKEVYEHLEATIDSIDYIGKLVRGIIVKQG